MRYQEAIDYILGFTDYERMPAYLYSSADFDLGRVRELLERLGAPHLEARAIHIAGTNGKGSIAAMIASVLQSAGYRTGLFTSPHLHTLRERIRVDGQPIAKKELAALVEKLRPEIHATRGLTTFEVLTALAFAHFKERKVDFQVLETGLGGRLDATNVMQPDICIITSISLDHTQILGNSLERIAAEKAGIIKSGSVVVSSPQPPQVAEVIDKMCRGKANGLITVGKDVTWKKKNFDLSGQSFRVEGNGYEYDLAIPLLGEHQLENAATAVAAIEALGTLGAKLPTEHITAGMAKVNWPGRLQILYRHPLVVVDGAHNANSAKRLREAIVQYFDFHHLILILGTSCDKDTAGIIGELAPLCSLAIVTHSHHPRSAPPTVLRDEFARLGVEAEIAQDPAVAIGQALKKAEENDLICATGSLFVAAEVIEYMKCLRGGGAARRVGRKSLFG